MEGGKGGERGWREEGRGGGRDGGKRWREEGKGGEREGWGKEMEGRGVGGRVNGRGG